MTVAKAVEALQKLYEIALSACTREGDRRGEDFEQALE